ncbi:MAG: cytochrome c biogenesis CcdA family protein [Rhodomicrobium sp.]
MNGATLGLSFVAGILSTLSPCVLPLLPIVLASAASEHRLAPAALAAGLALSFTAIALFVATVGFAIGLDNDVFRMVAAVLLIVIGIVLSIPGLQAKLSVAASPIAGWAESRLGGISGAGVSGQFAVGVLLGAVWSPCAGPALGAASLLASQGKDLGEVALVMILFGIGAALPLLAIGMLSREAALKLRGKLMGAGRALRAGLGAILIVLGAAILSGYDKQAETWLLNASPDWLTKLTTSI